MLTHRSQCCSICRETELSQSLLLPAAAPGLLKGPRWPLAPGSLGRHADLLVWEQEQGAFSEFAFALSKSGAGLPGETVREMQQGCGSWLCTGKMMVKGRVRFLKALALLQPFGGCSDGCSDPCTPADVGGICPSGSGCAMAPCFYSSCSRFDRRTVSRLR